MILKIKPDQLGISGHLRSLPQAVVQLKIRMPGCTGKITGNLLGCDRGGNEDFTLVEKGELRVI
jgi:hypothetical protein